MKFHLYILLTTIICLSCAANRPTKIQVYERKSESIESITMGGNSLDFFISNEPKPYRCSLNPGILITKSDTYYTLNFLSRNQKLPFELTNKDSLKLILDKSPITLLTLDVSRTGEGFSAYYRIDYLDLLDMGNVDQLQVIFYHGDTLFQARFSDETIYNYRYFNAKYILKADDIPEPDPQPYEQPWGFLSGGGGSTYDFWLGQYTNFISTESGTGDFIAAGFGLSPFSYSEWILVQDQPPPPEIMTRQLQPTLSWYELNEDRSSSYNFHVMYGLTRPGPIGNWSMEAGLSFYYYWSDERWIDGQDRYLDSDILTIIESGTTFKGPAIGGFIQFGGLWFQYNSKPSWSVGIALPVPWW
jgi:hypothetical protein